ncbi:MAG: hypothetical protein B7Y95_19885 [Rhizobiales bacterium 32-66-11]|nr:MAG: hypothetical protein B7Y95_19885 [Rhizobiales bacterium 32-66-11]
MHPPLRHGGGIARSPHHQDQARRPPAGAGDRAPSAARDPAEGILARSARDRGRQHDPGARGGRRLLRLLPDRQIHPRLRERSPAGCVRRLNDLLAVENEQMLFVTLFYGVLDLETGRLSFVNAGHNLPYRIARDGTLSTLPSTAGMAVAVMEGFVYVQHEMQLAPGDTLFLFTDGVTEAFDVDDEPYGEGRLESLLSQGVNTGHVPEVAERVLASIHAFERGAPQADDITCLTLRYFGGSGSHAVY